MELIAQNIEKSFGEKRVLGNITMSVEKGEIVSILGVSGVGKTTLFNILSGLMYPDNGNVMLEGNDITGEKGKLSYMLQKDMLMQHKTIIDNVALPMILQGEKKKVVREKAESYFKQFGIDGTQKQYPSALSGGMRQRAALLRTYLCGAKVALLDEPFSALDTITKGHMHEWYLKIMREIQMTTIFITHDVDEAIMLSDRIYIMKGIPAILSDEIVIKKDGQSKEAFELSEQFLEYKRMIKSLIS